MLTKVKLNSTKNLGNGNFLTSFSTKDLGEEIKPGQFLMIECGQFLNRPFSYCEVSGEKEFSVLYKTFGDGTEYLSSLPAGEELTINGPLGNGFEFPEDKDKKILIVAGGIGIAAFPFVAKTANESGYKVKTIFGARSKGDLVFINELKEFGEIDLITDDGSSGRKGFVTELLKEELEKDSNQEVLVCGPTPMLRSVIEVTNKYNINAQISFEEYMACGFGICMSCVVKINGKNTRTCVNGPVIRSNLCF